MNDKSYWISALLAISLLPAISLHAQEEMPAQVELPDPSEWPEETIPDQAPPPNTEPAPTNEPLPIPPPQSVSPPPPPSLPTQPQEPIRTESQTEPTTDSSPPDDATQPTLMGEAEDELADRETESILQWFTVSPQVGYIFFPKASLELNGLSSTVEARNGFIGKFHFDMGGDGLSFEFAPFIAIQAGGITPLENNEFGAADVSLAEGLRSGAFQAIGTQTTITYKFNAGYFFPSFGLGLHADYLMGEEIEYGTELYGRIPIGFSIYMGKHIALTFEAAFMYGVTGIKTPFRLPSELDPVMNDLSPNVMAEFDNASSKADYENWYETHQDELNQAIAQNQSELPADYKGYDSEELMGDLAADQLSESIRFGKGFGLEFSVGIRFP